MMKAVDDLSGLLWSYRLAELEPRVLPFAIRYRPEPRGELLLLLSALFAFLSFPLSFGCGFSA